MSYIVGLTGGIGSGKTTATNFFKDFNVKIVDTDIISRKLTSIGQPALKKISEKFGNKILYSNGELNRCKLKTIIFNSNTKKKWLENFLHPLIYKESQLKIKRLKCLWVIWVVPLLIEKNYHREVNRILVIDVSLNTQIKRIISRDFPKKNSIKNIKKIIKNQISRKKRLILGDDIINNNYSIKNLKKRVWELKNFYDQLALMHYIRKRK